MISQHRQVNWTDNAKLRLHAIHHEIAKHNSTAAAKQLAKLLDRSIELTTLPNIGRKVPEYQQKHIREILERPYRIIYLVKKDQIDVLTVIHYRQHLNPDVLKEMVKV